MNRAFWGNTAVIGLLVVAAVVLGLWQHGHWWQAPPLPRTWLWAGLTVVLYALAWAALRWARRPHHKDSLAPGSQAWLVAWASQTGYASELAELTARQLQGAGKAVRLRPIEQVDASLLAQTQHALFIVSTTGEGDAPDHAHGFLRGAMNTALNLSHLQVAVLALGDRSYAHYCAFGRQLDRWLQANQATELWPRIDMNNADSTALSQWQHALAEQLGQADFPAAPAPAASTPWTLAQRRQLNPGSQGGPAYHLQLTPNDPALLTWQAGDIALITPQHAPARVAQWLAIFGLDGAQRLADGRTLAEQLATVELPPALPAGNAVDWALTLPALKAREYSIASMPSDGHLALLLRRLTGPDGNPGLGSGWLCDTLQPQQSTQLRIRSNPSFHPPGNDTPLVLIGNGTGIAGLRSQLRARIDAGATRNWLLFGERSRACDYHFGAELDAWHAGGLLPKLDTTFSRDGGQHRHVQHALAAQADELKAWLDDGAVVMVCGSLKGMAPDVDAVIVQLLGQQGRDALLADGRYRRDVY